MTIAKVWLGLAASAFIFMCVCVGLLALDMRSKVNAVDVGKSKEQLAGALAEIKGEVGATRDLTEHLDVQINGRAGTAANKYHDKIEGVLPQVRQLLTNSRQDTIALNKQEDAIQKQILGFPGTEKNKFSDKVDGLLPLIRGKVEALDTKQVTSDLHNTSLAANTALGSIPPVMEQTKVDLASLDAEIKGLRPIEENLASMTASGAQIGKTVSVKVDQLAHPTRAQRVIGGILTALRGASYLGWLVK